MLRGVGLDIRPARKLRPPAAPDDLGEKAEGPLIASVVPAVKGHIRRQNAHEGHVREIKTLGDHLGPDHYIVLPVGKIGEVAVVAEFRHGRVEVHSENPRLREEGGKLVLDLLGSAAGVHNVLAAAGFAVYCRGLRVPAVVAHEPSVRLVINKRDIAAGALLHRSAFGAAGDGVVAPPVHQQYGLHTVIKVIFYVLGEGFAKNSRPPGHHFLLHIDDYGVRELRISVALAHFEKFDFPGLRPVESLY